MAELTTRVENTEDVQNLPEHEKKSLAVTALDNLSTQDRREPLQRFGVPGPAHVVHHHRRFSQGVVEP
jgi:hypothetical protein